MEGFILSVKQKEAPLEQRVFATVVEDVSAKTLFEFIKKKTKKGSVFYADDFKSYKDLKQYGKHNRVKHSKTFGKPFFAFGKKWRSQSHKRN